MDEKFKAGPNLEELASQFPKDYIAEFIKTGVRGEIVRVESTSFGVVVRIKVGDQFKLVPIAQAKEDLKIMDPASEEAGNTPELVQKKEALTQFIDSKRNYKRVLDIDYSTKHNGKVFWITKESLENRYVFAFSLAAPDPEGVMDNGLDLENSYLRVTPDPKHALNYLQKQEEYTGYFYVVDSKILFSHLRELDFNGEDIVPGRAIKFGISVKVSKDGSKKVDRFFYPKGIPLGNNMKKKSLKEKKESEGANE